MRLAGRLALSALLLVSAFYLSAIAMRSRAIGSVYLWLIPAAGAVAALEFTRRLWRSNSR